MYIMSQSNTFEDFYILVSNIMQSSESEVTFQGNITSIFRVKNKIRKRKE
jgi:hypothetical protein